MLALRSPWLLAPALLALSATLRAEVPAELAQRVQALARQGATALLAQQQARVEVQVGEINPRLHLAPCNQIQPYLLPGTPIWGRTRVGLRCVDGAVRWNVSLPLTVQVFSKVLVARSALPGGATLEAAQFELGEVDIADGSGLVFIDAKELVGRKLDRPLEAGQPVRSTDLVKRRWFAAGERVKLQAVGAGFAVDGEGEAMSVGMDMENTKVRLDNGRMVEGRAVGDHRVEVLP